MKNQPSRRAPGLVIALLLGLAALAQAAPPDLTAAGVIATINRSGTFNLGPTGLRGWIYSAGDGSPMSLEDGTISGPSRQILVTVASAPGNAVLAVDDVILGAMAGSSGAVPLFTSDCRKAFGVAIGNAEKTGAGTLRVKRWRAGTISDVNIPMTIMGDYAATAPYTCPKSALILANARIKLVSQLLADPGFLNYGYGGSIKGLALLAGVVPGDADYAAVQTRLQTYARSLAPASLALKGCDTWQWSYINIFLSEYYMRTLADGAADASVLHGINEYTVAMSKAQSRYGTFGHGGSLLKADGSLHGTVPPYGPVNQAGLIANLAIVMGKKALLAAAQPINPEIDPAIARADNFFSYFVNKGTIPYGEHAPEMVHENNGKSAMCAVLFGQQDNRTVETEYFCRMAMAGFNAREAGHTGAGFSYLWSAMGANHAGPLAIAEYLKQVRWHLDLERRTDGSFVYDGDGGWNAGSTADGTYLGKCGYYEVSPTATYILTYALPLRRLCITGKNANPAHTLDPTKVAHAIATASFRQTCTAYTTSQLMTALGDYSPVSRTAAAAELAKRTLTPADVTSLITLAEGSNINQRQGACEALGLLQNASALPALGRRLSDPDLWVRAKAAKALIKIGPAASPQLTPMLTAFAANATDPEVIVWNDPVQIANGFLSNALFQTLQKNTIAAPKSLLWPAVKVCLKQPDSNPRNNAADFARNNLTLEDVQALAPDLFQCITSESQADTMWSMYPRGLAIGTLAKHKIAEAIPMALAMQEVPEGFGWGSEHFRRDGMNALSSFGDSARWTLPALRKLALTWNDPTLNSTIAKIEAAITSPSGITNLAAVADPQVVATMGAKAITLTGSSCRGTAVTFVHVTAPAHGTLTGTAPNLTYTPAANYRGLDHFTFRTTDSLTTSEPGMVSVIVGPVGTGLKGEYFDNVDFTNLKVTRIDPQVNFDWGTGAPDPSIGTDTFSVRWSGLLLVPESGTYTFSTLNSGDVRFYINGANLIENHMDQSASWKDSVPMSLKAGQVLELQMEYCGKTSPAVAKLKWTGPSFAGRNGLPIAKEWLYDGSGATNRAAYAHAQSVTLVQNAAQAITLTGSAPPLSYSVVTQPAHGRLAGAAPNLIYTPAANFSGSDSFTFLVSNGTRKSAPATVSLAILAGEPVSYFWSKAVAGNWSDKSNWTNAVGGTVTPAATGQAFYSLNFNKPGTYATTHDLNNNVSFNQLNVAGKVTFAGTGSLSPTANGPFLPQINQNSMNTVTFTAPLNLTAMTAMGGMDGGSVVFTSVISGPGGLIKNSLGNVDIPNVTNTYSGGTIINSGTISLGLQANQSLGTGPVTLNRGGTLALNRISASNPLILNGGTIIPGGGWGNTFSGPVTMNFNMTINVGDDIYFSGNISGAGGFTKRGNNTLTLNGTNSFTGANTIKAGTLQCRTADALGSGSLDISEGGKVALNYTGTRTIAALTFKAGAALPPGTYGSTASPATNKNDTYFSGTGTVTILPAATKTVMAPPRSSPRPAPRSL